MTERIVVVGASLAGLRAAESLRSAQFDGEVVIVGDETHRPYNRPPLSKDLLLGEETPEGCALRVARDVDFVWRLGCRAEALDADARQVRLEGGERLDFDGLVIATGARARRWPGETPAGVRTLRTLDDAVALREAIGAVAGRVVIVGAGFIGSEVASSCRARGLDVCLVDLEAAPLAGALGEPVGTWLAGLHADNGVDFRPNVTVDAFLGGERLRGAQLSDGSTVEAELAVVAIGVDANTEWLTDSGLTIDDGVVCDAHLRCVGADRVVAAGDVARWPHPAFDGERVAVAHWSNAVAQGRAAARSLVRAEDGPFADVPTFWSDLHGTSLRSVGLPELGDEIRIAEGSTSDGCFVATYARGGTLVGAVSVERHERLRTYQESIERGASVAEAHRH